MPTVTFNSGSGTYTATSAGMLEIELWGAGGSTPDSSGGPVNGAGAGAYCKKTLTVALNDVFPYVVGAEVSNSTGGDSTVTGPGATVYRARGGASSVTGGTAINGDINSSGGNGTAASGGSDSGSGGTSPNGGTGGVSVTSGRDANAGTAPGGGAGGASDSGGGALGGAGRVKMTLTPSASAKSRRSQSARTGSRSAA